MFSSSEFSDKIKNEVDKVKRSEEWRREYMTLYLHEQEIKRESREEGRKEGLLLGVQILKEYNSGVTVEILAEKYNLSAEEIEEIVKL